jgi:hypothetical protein
MPQGRLFVVCGLAVFGSLIVVGIVSDGIARHILQTLAVWPVIALGMRGSSLTKWAALPVFLFWLAIMVLIWLFLLHWARIVSGHFTPIEVAMTVLVGGTSTFAIAGVVRDKSHASWPMASLTFLTLAALQVCVFALSLQSPFYSDTALLAWLHAQ